MNAGTAGRSGGFFEKFTDAHAHLPSDASADERLARPPAGTRILLNSTRLKDFPRVVAIAKKFPSEIVPAFGIHPWFAEEWNGEAEKLLRHALREIPGATVGEIGLDRSRARKRNEEETQRRAFREQLAIAAEFRVPASLHCVRDFGAMESILREIFSARAAGTPFLLHAYSGSAEQAKIFARLGGVFSSPKRAPLPRECIVVPETDAELPSLSGGGG